jgi:aminoglycoside phosphotransferase (APT) family kinase protein
VWLVDTGSLDVVVRFLADDRRMETERRLLEVVGAAGIPVAEVLWAEVEPVPVFVQRRLPGRMLADVEPTDTACRSVAEMLRLIHTVPIARGFGLLGPDLAGSAARLSTWFVDLVRTEVDALDDATGDRRLLDDALARLDDARDLLDRQVPRLAHGDVQPFNVLIGDDDQVAGVLDWEAAKSGPPAFDLGWWDWFSVSRSTPWPTERLLEHYGDVPDDTDELRPLVVQRVWMRELAAAIRNGEAPRAAAARKGLAASYRLPPFNS